MSDVFRVAEDATHGELIDFYRRVHHLPLHDALLFVTSIDEFHSLPATRQWLFAQRIAIPDRCEGTSLVSGWGRCYQPRTSMCIDGSKKEVLCITHALRAMHAGRKVVTP